MNRRARAIARLGASYTVTRQAAGAYTNGIWVDGAVSRTFSIIASVQPVTGLALQQLPEAYHSDEVRQVFTASQLLVGPPPDELLIDGVTWYVIEAHKWETRSEVHYEVMISRKS